MKKAGLKRDVYMDGLPPEAKTWYMLKHGALPNLRIAKRARSDGKGPEPCYIEYILTDKVDEDINWDTTNEQ